MTYEEMIRKRKAILAGSTRHSVVLNHSANVSLDQNDNLIFDIPSGPKCDRGNTGPVGPQGSRGYNVWAMKMTAGGNVSGRYITDLYNASATNLPAVNDLVVQPDGNVFSITNVYKDTTPGAGDGGGTFDIGPALFSVKGNTPSEDDILVKTKQYVDDAILNGKW